MMLIDVLEALAPLIDDCQEETPAFDVLEAANEYLAKANVPFRFRWNQNDWRYEAYRTTEDDRCPNSPRS